MKIPNRRRCGLNACRWTTPLRHGTAGVRYVSFRRLLMKVQTLKQETMLARERTRIARDLHDEFGNRLTELGLIAEVERKASIGASRQSEILPIIRSLEQDLDTIVW